MLKELRNLIGHELRGPLPDLDTLRSRLVRLALAYILCFAAPLVLLGLYRSLPDQWNWYSVVQFLAYACLLLAYFLSPRNCGKGLCYLIVGIVVMVGVCGIAAWGPAPSRLIILSFGCVFAAMLHGATFSMIALVLSTALVCLAAYTHPNLVIVDGGDSVSDHTPKQWFVTVSSFAFYTACCSLLVAWLTRSLQSTITVLRKREEELQRSNEILLEQTVKLEEQAVELEEQAEGLIEERDKADAAAGAKDRFLSVISHELRTPLNPIIGFLDLLQEDESLRTDCKEKLDLIQRSGEHLLLMIDKVVDFSELDRRELTINRVQTSWQTLRSEISSRLQPLAHERRLELKVDCDGSAEDCLLLDKRRTLQVIDELGSNALNFTVSGSVAIKLSLNKREDDSQWLSIEVKDTGNGMDEEEIAGLFDSFTQRDGSRTREVGGLGLGLSVCDAIVSVMGGSIKVESSLGKGSTFLAEFPVGFSQIATSKVSSLHGPRVFPEPISVLVAEDDPLNQKVVKALLKRLGAKATCVADGSQALEALRIESYDVVLMDLSMPVMDGITATKEIRMNEGLRGIPIIALTAHSYAKSESACFEAGMNAFLTKPTKANDLFETITKALEPKLNAPDSVWAN